MESKKRVTSSPKTNPVSTILFVIIAVSLTSIGIIGGRETPVSCPLSIYICKDIHLFMNAPETLNSAGKPGQLKQTVQSFLTMTGFCFCVNYFELATLPPFVFGEGVLPCFLIFFTIFYYHKHCHTQRIFVALLSGCHKNNVYREPCFYKNSQKLNK